MCVFIYYLSLYLYYLSQKSTNVKDKCFFFFSVDLNMWIVVLSGQDQRQSFQDQITSFNTLLTTGQSDKKKHMKVLVTYREGKFSSLTNKYKI